MRVRWSQRCAGTCEQLLLAGSYAESRHRGLWCASCLATHQERCETCRERAGRVPVVRRDREQTLLW